MLSQYSWWDFIKVVLVGLIIYYAYVVWAYYREDIREWLSSRGEKADPKPDTADEPEEEAVSSLFAVNHYAPAAQSIPGNQPAPARQSDPVSQPPLSLANEVNLTGRTIDEDPAVLGFSLPLAVEPQRPAEQSLSVLINAAHRLQAGSDGVLVADDPDDSVAANLAEVINQQQGRSALAGIAFNR